MKGVCFLLPVIIGCFPVLAQRGQQTDDNIQQTLEEIIPFQDEDINYSEIYENLLQLRSQPLDLNKATEEQFRSMYLLNESQLRALLKYRHEYGPFQSIYELQVVPGLDAEVISRLRMFVAVKNPSGINKSTPWSAPKYQNRYLLLRQERDLEINKGYQAASGPAYPGSADKLYARFRASRPGDFSYGFTMEKDAGEKITWAPGQRIYGFDYLSFHMMLANKGHLKSLIVGDFQAQFGQGLILGGAFGIGKGSETIASPRRSNLGFLPYTSIRENGFFHGAAASYQLGNGFIVHGFISDNRRDASTDTVNHSVQVSSFDETGYHRTVSERAKRKIMEETNFGTSIEFRQRKINAGIIANQTRFGLPVSPKPTNYNQFYFAGTDNTNASIYLNYNWNNVSFFSEAAHTLQAGSAMVMGIASSLSAKFDMTVVFRRYGTDYHSLYGNAFSESSRPQNESGLYYGWKFALNNHHWWSGYVDLFQFPWLRFRAYAPSNGYEWLIRYTFQPAKSIVCYAQAREESKIRNLTEQTLYQTAEGIKRNIWLSIHYSANHALQLKTRVQFSSFTLHHLHTRGFAILQDLRIKLKRIVLSARYALFDTDDFENRQYAYEQNVWLAYALPFYAGVGTRKYILFRYSISRGIDIWARWSQTRYTRNTMIGSGNDSIVGNHQNDLKFQLRLKF